jgi:putative Mn2+ efflux pump MntP
VLRLILFVLPLSLDTFAVSAALGMGGLPREQRLRVSLSMSSFEMTMPIIGLLVGHQLGHVVGRSATYVAVALLAGLGAWMVFHEKDDERNAVAALALARGVALFALGLSISLDELAIGFTIGLLHLSLGGAVLLIGAQAFVAAQIGLRLGARLNERSREGAERAAGVALLGLATFILVDTLAP